MTPQTLTAQALINAGFIVKGNCVNLKNRTCGKLEVQMFLDKMFPEVDFELKQTDNGVYFKS